MLIACHELHESGVFFAMVKGAGFCAIAGGVFILAHIRNAKHIGLVKGRMARGECVGCGYPLGTHACCTECGRSADRQGPDIKA